jgi:RNA polymerase sigma-70 factor (ECF subfamily)
MPSQESTWLDAARRFDQKALSAIYDAFSEELYRYAFRLIGDVARAEDLMSETFSRFLKALERGGGPKTHLRAYLYRTTHNLAMDQLRRAKKEVIKENVEPQAERSTLNPEQSVELKHDQEQAIAMLEKLTEEQHQVLILKFFQGMNNDEVAATMEKSVGAVKALQHRALNSLRRAFEALHEEKERAA